MAGRYCYKEVLPFAAMAAMEVTYVGTNTLFKAASSRGMSYFVYMVYCYGTAALVLLPVPFISLRSGGVPPPNFYTICKIGLLGLTGYSMMILGYVGIDFSSPTLASAISSLVPAFTFILAIIFRMEKLALQNTGCQAKILGTIVSISGAFVVTFYKGQPIVAAASPAVSFHQPLHTSQSSWIAGSLLLSADYMLYPVWYILQTHIINEYPAELLVVFLYNLYVTVIAAIVGLIAETNLSAWRVRMDIAIASSVSSGLLGSLLGTLVHTWGLRLKGPVYVTMFKPLSMAIAVAMGAVFLGDTLHVGSLVGAIIIAIGFYTVLWGKANEETGGDCGDGSLESCTQKTPLLHNPEIEKV